MLFELPSLLFEKMSFSTLPSSFHRIKILSVSTSICVCCMLGMGRIGTSSAQAQRPDTVRRVADRADGTARPSGALRTDPRIPVPSDTGRAITGYQSYAHYDAPSQCVSAIKHLANDLRAWSGLWYDTVAYAGQLQEQTPAVVRTETQRCIAHFTAAAVAPRELPFLLQLAVVSGDTLRARAVIDRRLALAPSMEAKAAIILEAMQTYLHHRPARLTEARAVLARLDTVAPMITQARIDGHQQLLQIACALFDRKWMHEEVEAILPLLRSLPVAQRVRGWLWWEYAEQKLLLYEKENVDSAMLAFAVWLNAIPTTFWGGEKLGGVEGTKIMAAQAYAPVGQMAPPIPAIAWSPNLGVKSYPQVGKTTLIVRLQTDNLGLNSNKILNLSTWQDHVASRAHEIWHGSLLQLRAVLTRLNEKYGPKGLQIVVVLSSGGVTPPVTEAERLALTKTWFATQFSFPIVVGQEMVPFQTLPAPDGRRLYRQDSITTDSIYQRLDNFQLLLTDTTGKFRWGMFMRSTVESSIEVESEMEAFVRKSLGIVDTAAAVR